jgi:DNA-directed RNA polymerase subunit RPC12/RpoP
MTAKVEGNKKTKMEWVLPLFKGYVYSTAVLLGSIGVMLILITWHCKRREMQPLLNAPDPLFGFANRTVLLLAGALHLALSGCLFAMRDLVNRMVAALWVGLNYFFYRAAMVWVMEITTPLPMENFVGWRRGVKPETVDLYWKLFIAYLVIGSSVLMLLELWRLKQLKNEAWVKHWLETRDQDCPRGKPVVPKPPDNANDYMTISCPHCGGYVEFPAHGIGQEIACPHCAAIITLQKPDAS